MDDKKLLDALQCSGAEAETLEEAVKAAGPIEELIIEAFESAEDPIDVWNNLQYIIDSLQAAQNVFSE